MNHRNTTALRVLTLEEVGIVSGAKRKVTSVLVERCESRHEGGKKISVCTVVGSTIK